MFKRCARLLGSPRWLVLLLSLFLAAPAALAQQMDKTELVDHNAREYQVRKPSDGLSMTVNSSLILTMETDIPRFQVDDPEVLVPTPLSSKQVQIHAKKVGNTTVSLWGENDQVYTLKVAVWPDARELDGLLKSAFPGAVVHVRPTAAGVMLGGYADRADDVYQITQLAQQYYPKVLNNLRVGGAPQVLLNVKVMEVSRTKLRELGVDFTEIFRSGSAFFSSSAAGLAKVTSLPQAVAQVAPPIDPVTATVGSLTSPTLSLGLVDSNGGFFLFIQALQRNDLLKVLAEPKILTLSGRPAYFQSGGEMPVPVPQSLGTISIQWRKFGTQVDFVPIVLGGGRIHLDVRPKVSEIDNTVAINLNGSIIPGFRVRECDTGCELMAGQTLALAGLVQVNVNASKQGIPYLQDVPYLGVPFRHMTEKVNEIELLILVRPELAEAMDCDQVPPVGPGVGTTSPDDCGLFWKGYFEVPAAGPQGPGGPGHPGPIGPAGPDGVRGIGPGIEIEPIAPPQPQARTKSEPPTAPDGSSPLRMSVSPKPNSPGAGGADESLRSADRRASSEPPAKSRDNRANPHSRQKSPPAKPESEPPAFIGPTGYDVNE